MGEMIWPGNYLVKQNLLDLPNTVCYELYAARRRA